MKKKVIIVGIIVFVLVAFTSVLAYILISTNTENRSNAATLKEGSENLDLLKMISDEESVPATIMPEEKGSGDTSKDAPTKAKTLVSASAQKNISASEKPNVLFIISDDQPYNTLGIAGNKEIKTPNIDALANTGFYLNNMYLPIGHCAPSRASLFTGKMPHNHGVTTNGYILPPNQLTLTEILQAGGYDTAIIGKCHLGDVNNSETYKRGFDTRILFYPDNGVLAYKPSLGANSWNYFDIMRNGKVEKVENQYVTDFLTDESIKFVDKNKKDGTKPFFLWLAYNAPHIVPPNPTTSYKASDITLPASITDDRSGKPLQESYTSAIDNFDAPVMWTPVPTLQEKLDGVKEMKRRTYEILSNMDSNVGRLVAQLKKNGQFDNTIIVFVSDNGLFYGEHQLFQKGPYMYDEIMKTPFIISYPKMFKKKTVSSALTSSIDIMPTILDMLKINKPTDIDGKSFLPLLNGTTTKARDFVYMEYFRNMGNTPYINLMRGVVNTDGYKLINYYSGDMFIPSKLRTSTSGTLKKTYQYNAAMYNLNTDKLEMTNLTQRISDTDEPLLRTLALNNSTSTALIKLLKQQATGAIETNDIEIRKINTFEVTTTSNSAKAHVVTDYPTIYFAEVTDSSGKKTEVNNITPATDFNINFTNLKAKTKYTVKLYISARMARGTVKDFTFTTK
jgi:arylsulfatase A-like enzyme